LAASVRKSITGCCASSLIRGPQLLLSKRLCINSKRKEEMLHATGQARSLLTAARLARKVRA
jgi:hypothetical protein